MNEDEYNSVVNDMRLTNGLLFGLPVVLDTDRDDLTPGTKVTCVSMMQHYNAVTPSHISDTAKGCCIFCRLGVAQSLVTYFLISFRNDITLRRLDSVHCATGPTHR